MSNDNVGCYQSMVPNPNEIWKSESVTFVYLPILAYQMILIVFGTRFLYYIMRPLNQPRLVTDLIAGIALSLGFMLKNTQFVSLVLPVKTVLVSTTISYVGIVYYVFLSGLEMNLNPVIRAHRKPTTIAITGTAIPMALGVVVYIVYQKLSKAKNEQLGSYVMWSLVLSVTGFPVLTQVLADLKILYTGLGELALAAGTISDFYNWVMFAMITPFFVNGKKAYYSVLSTLAFVLFSFFVVRPLLRKVIVTDTTNKNDWDNYHLSFVVTGVFVYSAITDLLGTNPIVGALVYGLIMPRGKFTENLIEKSDDFGSGYLAPAFFASCGMRFNIIHLMNSTNIFSVLLVVVLSSAVKVIGTIIATRFFGIPFLDSVALGVLMNTKGILSLIMLNIAWDKKMLSSESFSIMLLSVLIMTMLVAPTINAIYKPRKLFEKNKLRTIQMLKTDAEIRVLACCHNTRHAVGMIKILEALSGTNVTHMRVSVCQLVELKSRATAMLSAHIKHHNNPNQPGGSQGLTQSQEDFETMTKYFEAYALDHEYNRVDTHAVVSAYETIHRDIYNLAMEKSSSFVLLPFHKHSSTEGTLEMANEAFRQINQNVIKDAPCSVGTYVERGLVSLTKANWNIITVFIGGPDDREALALAWRMSRHPRIQLTFVRIMLVGNAAEVDKTAHQQSRAQEGILSTVLDSGKQKRLDDEYVSSFRLTAVNNEDSITYLEKEVRSGDDVPRVLNELDQRGYDLYILGHGRGRSSIVFADLWNWCDCPELGVLGDLVASSSFGSSSSVLVVQQYVFGGVDFGTSNTNNTEQVSDQPAAPVPGFNRLL